MVVFSCNKIEVLDQIVFDYNQLPKIVLSAEQKKITETYEAKFSEPFIDHSLIKPPKEHLKSWIDSNLAIIGTEISFFTLEIKFKSVRLLQNQSMKSIIISL